ncbi:MAG: heat shock protein 70, partial [bacterium]
MRSAAEIGGYLLEFLHQSALDKNAMVASRVVVTVPASFQAAQRHDTLKAADLAGLHLTGGDLLDEPIAAFLDYLITYRETFIKESTEPKSLIVFDFGGGTCDVALFRLQMPNRSRRLKTSPLAVSRYHRLGGGDIDAAIVYDVLIPQLVKENELSQFDLTFEDKKKFLEPALLGIAEALKVGLCGEILQLQKFGKYESVSKSQVFKQQPGTFSYKLKNRVLTLQSPKLTAAQFEDILKPFLDPDLVFARETEYRMTCSIFAPLQDALDRSGL